MPKGQRWFRFYSAVMNCAKAQQLSDRHFRGWVNVLCAASENDGVLPELNQLAFKLRMKTLDTDLLLQALIKAKLLDQLEYGRLMPHDWNEHQYVSDVSTRRVRAFRERSRNVSEAPSDTEQIQIQNRTDGGRAETATPPPLDPPKPLTILEQDSGYDEFFRLWSERGKDLASDADWADFRRFEWGPAGFHRQQETLAGARACPGPWLGTPRSWMRQRGWQRVANPNAPNRGPQRVDVLALGRKLQAEEDAKKKGLIG